MARVTVIELRPDRAGAEHDQAPSQPDLLLEAGEIITIHTPGLLPTADLELLRHRDRVSGAHKNIAYDPRTDRVTGVGANDPAADALRRILHTYAERITAVVAKLLPDYARAWTVDVTSFRPLEEARRRLSDRARNDRLHIDAFPSRPTHGGRILRAFTNIHPTQPRRWLSGDPLDRLLPSLSQLPGFPLPRPQQLPGRTLRLRVARWLGTPALARSAFDRSMLRLHDFMKQNDAVQELCQPTHHDFVPNATWIVFTDAVPHAVLSGRHALEQTYIVPRGALRAPARSPLMLLEEIAGGPLV